MKFRILMGGRPLSDFSCTEIMEYLALDQIEPLENPWLQTGVICSALTGEKPETFIPKKEKKARGKELLAKLKTIFRGQSG